MSDSTTIQPETAAPAKVTMTREQALREAARLASAGDLANADQLLRALYRPEVRDVALMVSWARLRRRAGDLKNAVTMLEQAVGWPGGAIAIPDLAGALIDSGRVKDAGNLLRQAPAASGPLAAALEFERGRVQEASRRVEPAIFAYRAAMRADPNHIDARLALARLLVRTGQTAEAVRAFTALLNRYPNHLQALSDLAWLYGTERRFKEALACYDKLEAAGVDAVHNVSMVTLGMMHMCDWSMRDALRARLEARFADPRPCIMEAYALLALSDDPAAHRHMATRMADAIRAHTAKMARPAARGIGSGRLKIGFLCGDFHQHATSLQFAGVIEAFDRERFELTAYDYSPEDKSAIRARMEAAFEHFVRLGMETQEQSAARIAADRIDILVDMKGYTERTRTEIMVLRPAPVQVSFLGYVGTQAGEWMDYVIADATVLPLSEAAHWSEKIVHMPHSYYRSDRTRPTPAPDRDRAAHGLPADGFVFACFNNPFKLSPAYFSVWMELLREVPGSVLWLYAGNEYMPDNLRAAAAAAGVAPDRLVFTKPVSLEAHIARHGCIDMFLDTGPYGAHTTGVDALWAGVPVLTCMGRSFASRVGGSLLNAVGLPELITETIEDYKAVALALARDPARLAALRAKLETVADTVLFDAAAFARGLEDAFTTMAERHRAGMAPDSFAVQNRMSS
jgi:predicted O-linked N-acetylglucosamine transferase (SPINDLY family)